MGMRGPSRRSSTGMQPPPLRLPSYQRLVRLGRPAIRFCKRAVGRVSPWPTQETRRMARRRILVTGGSGFLGSHLCERLIADGHEVVCLDNFFTGSRVNVEHLLDNHRFELVRHDVTEPLIMEVDEVFHLACPA